MTRKFYFLYILLLAFFALGNSDNIQKTKTSENPTNTPQKQAEDDLWKVSHTKNTKKIKQTINQHRVKEKDSDKDLNKELGKIQSKNLGKNKKILGGPISQIDKGKNIISVKRKSKEYPIFILRTTKLSQNNQPLKFTELKKGDLITVHYIKKNGVRKASKLVLNKPTQEAKNRRANKNQAERDTEVSQNDTKPKLQNKF